MSAITAPAMSLPVAAAVVGIPDLEVLESCARIAKTLQPMSDQERERMRKQIAAAVDVRTLPYLACGYTDGETRPA